MNKQYIFCIIQDALFLKNNFIYSIFVFVMKTIFKISLFSVSVMLFTNMAYSVVDTSMAIEGCEDPAKTNELTGAGGGVTPQFTMKLEECTSNGATGGPKTSCSGSGTTCAVASSCPTN